MVFDVRGRRKHVVRVVYAILALLMGASLFLVVGPFNAATLLGGESTKSAASIDLEQAEKIEERLRRDPKNEALLLSLTRARIVAAGALSEVNPETGLPVPTPEALIQYTKALEAWVAYTKQADEPNPVAAKQIAETYIRLAEFSATTEEANSNIAKAAKTQRIAAAAQPSLGSLSSLASYEYFAGNYPQGDKAAAEASKKTTTKAEAKELQEKMTATRLRAKQYEKEVKEFEKKESEAGKERLQNPFGGLGSSTGTLGE
jgi:vacuolar-type H+-ATPase subunit I/STV1